MKTKNTNTKLRNINTENKNPKLHDMKTEKTNHIKLIKQKNLLNVQYFFYLLTYCPMVLKLFSYHASCVHYEELMCLDQLFQFFIFIIFLRMCHGLVQSLLAYSNRISFSFNLLFVSLCLIGRDRVSLSSTSTIVFGLDKLLCARNDLKVLAFFQSRWSDCGAYIGLTLTILHKCSY